MYDTEYEEEVRKQAVMSVSIDVDIVWVGRSADVNNVDRKYCPMLQCMCSPGSGHGSRNSSELGGGNGKRLKRLYVKVEDGILHLLGDSYFPSSFEVSMKHLYLILMDLIFV